MVLFFRHFGLLLTKYFYGILNVFAVGMEIDFSCLDTGVTKEFLNPIEVNSC